MQIVTSLTNEPNQLHTLILENNDTADLRLYYFARMQSWYIDLEYGEKVIKGLKVVLSPNLLRQFRKVLPFGLSFFADNSYVEPFEIEAFSSNRVQMGIINKEEIQDIEENIYND